MVLLEDECRLPPSDVRTIKLSTHSFLDSTLSEGSNLLYSILTDDSQTTLSRYDKREGSSDGASILTEVATVYWLELESPESSPTDSPTFAARWVRGWSSKDAQDRRNIMVEADGRTLKLSEFLRVAAFGGSRKFTVDSKTFKWKHVDGLWQCFHAKRMIAVFEPSIVTAGARIRILPTDISITRRIMDMLVLTCLLVVTHPTEWRRRARGARSVRFTQQPTIKHARTTPVTISASSPMFNTDRPLRRAQSYDGNTLILKATADYQSRPSLNIPVSAPPTNLSHQRASQSISLPKLVIPEAHATGSAVSTTTTSASVSGSTSGSASMSAASEKHALRRAYSIPALHSATQSEASAASTTDENGNSRALTILSRSTSTRRQNGDSSVRRSPSSSSLTSPRPSRLRLRPNLSPIASPVADGRRSSDLDLTPSPQAMDEPKFSLAQRPWERPNAYPLPYSAISPPASTPDLSPPPYARRDRDAILAIAPSIQHPTISGPRRRNEKAQFSQMVKVV